LVQQVAQRFPLARGAIDVAENAEIPIRLLA
jgi:hypothetical protein